MGAIIELPTSAGGWTLEMRSESFYLGIAAWNEYKLGDGPAPAVGLHARKDGKDNLHGAFRVPINELKHILTVFDVVISHPGYEPGDQEPRSWQAELVDEGQQLVAEGPMVAYGVGTEWERCGTVELLYAGLGDLRSRLEQFAR